MPVWVVLVVLDGIMPAVGWVFLLARGVIILLFTRFDHFKSNLLCLLFTLKDHCFSGQKNGIFFTPNIISLRWSF